MASTPAKNRHAVALGRRGGKATSDAKAAASRANGKKGGRPKTSSVLRAIADRDPMVPSEIDGSLSCFYCSAWDGDQHEAYCLWRIAREWPTLR